MIIAIYVYQDCNPDIIRPSLGEVQILLRIIAGFTEPDEEKWFKTFSTGRFLFFIWSLTTFFMCSIFTTDLRSVMISPIMEKPIEKIEDITNFGRRKILMHYDEGALLSPTDQRLLKFLVQRSNEKGCRSSQAYPCSVRRT